MTFFLPPSGVLYSIMLARRSFLSLLASAAFTGPALLAQSARRQNGSDVPLVDQVPPMLDHILLGCNDLQNGIAFVEKQTGVRAIFGGVHPGRGTQNALLSLGERRYLEIIAPDPNQPNGTWSLLTTLKKLDEPRLVGWAAHPRNIEALAAQLKRNGIAAEGPTPGSRKRPDGSVLHWQTLNLQDDAGSLLPFFIQWSDDSTHPSADAPSGCQLLQFELLTPDPAGLAKLADQMSLHAPIAKGPSRQLHAVIQGQTGQLSVTS